MEGRPMNISVSERAELRELAKKATPGPWVANAHEDWHQPQTEVEAQGRQVVRFLGGDLQFWATIGKAEYEWANARYIAAAHPLKVQALLDALDAAENEVAKMRSLLSAQFDACVEWAKEVRAAESKVATLEQALSEARKWQPIETAPKDGTDFLAIWLWKDNRGEVCGTGSHAIISWEWQYDAWMGAGLQPIKTPPSHWMPLPTTSSGSL